jgi:hypothetical protein
MSVRVYWEDQSKTIVRYDFAGAWTWNELYAAYYEAIAMERSVAHRVDVILDLRASGPIPANALLHLKNFSEKQPPNIGLSFFVTSNNFIRSLYQVGTKFYGKIAHYFRVAATLEEASAAIAADRKPQVEQPETP